MQVTVTDVLSNTWLGNLSAFSCYAIDLKTIANMDKTASITYWLARGTCVSRLTRNLLSATQHSACWYWRQEDKNQHEPGKLFYCRNAVRKRGTSRRPESVRLSLSHIRVLYRKAKDIVKLFSA